MLQSLCKDQNCSAPGCLIVAAHAPGREQEVSLILEKNGAHNIHSETIDPLHPVSSV